MSPPGYCAGGSSRTNTTGQNDRGDRDRRLDAVMAWSGVSYRPGY
jgi:hypothetical protein